MSTDMIQQELIQLDFKVKDANEFFIEISNKLENLGYVKETFCDAIIKREKNYPTGLPTQPFAVAIPHTDPTHINKQFIAITRLDAPIKWCEMATADVWHDVKFVFMLGFQKENGHIELLQTLIEYFQNEDFMNSILECKTEAQCMRILSTIKGL